MKHPKVTIIMATYNRAHLLVEALESIVVQSFKNWECLIIDDGSLDNTSDVVTHFMDKDERFKYLPRSKDYIKGLPGCRNQGLDLAKGDYIIFFDDDDIVHPDNLKICTKLLFDKELYFCRYDKEPFFGEWKSDTLKSDSGFTSKFVDLNDIENMVIGKLPFASCTVLWKRNCFEDQRFNEGLLYAEEWECYSRILSTGIKGISIDKVLYYNRKHPCSNTGEFYNNNSVRRASNLLAINLVIDNLSQKGLLSSNLVQYFIRTGFLLNEISVIEKILRRSNAGALKRLKYLLGYKIYPVLKPVFNLKAKLKKY
ncbi:glycosyltransferase involved in cell wall biosynthesis [Gillisia mitskevichiae]|uniref:Glycosyltransferase involved in cell wall biosynthesis n=1 Tax=Gillisia mitskevichiae TaxID=270921 RepID=A0A495P5N0_9FLAO|nr:glycosyltransferase family 2 protein [Gillisia mitskevichiae]RKS45140.1 glycosyltransferase involved in cell wall biosynthesis [Gillisia mitskevichiae]